MEEEWKKVTRNLVKRLEKGAKDKEKGQKIRKRDKKKPRSLKNLRTAV
jgi:hypothetical protein